MPDIRFLSSADIPAVPPGSLVKIVRLYHEDVVVTPLGKINPCGEEFFVSLSDLKVHPDTLLGEVENETQKLRELGILIGFDGTLRIIPESARPVPRVPETARRMVAQRDYRDGAISLKRGERYEVVVEETECLVYKDPLCVGVPRGVFVFGEKVEPRKPPESVWDKLGKLELE
jgi:hypothetical protein